MHARINRDSKGQSTIEGAIFLSVFAVALIFTLKLALKFILVLAVDDFLESYLLCNVYQPKAYCQSVLQQKMGYAHLRLNSVQLTENSDKLIAHLEVSSGLFENFRRSREYLKR